MQVFDDRIQAESGTAFHPDSVWIRSSKTCMKLPVPNVQKRTPDDGQRGCPKHVEFYDKINLDN